jgi:hypothetical protein
VTSSLPTTTPTSTVSRFSGSTASTPKTFRQQHWNGTAWINGKGGAPTVLYRLPKVRAEADRNGVVWLAEGEKDVHALEAAGVVGTCNAGGAGKFNATHATQLQGVSLVVIVVDNDAPGYDHARKVAGELTLNKIPYQFVMAAEGKDAADHLRNHGLDEFITVATLEAADPAETQPNPIPLDTGHRHGPPFPLHAVPEWISKMCTEVEWSYQVPADLPAMLALGCLSTLTAGKIRINVEGTNWTEHTNLYLVTAMPPGSGKIAGVRGNDQSGP